jgi:hypothetical protein
MAAVLLQRAATLLKSRLDATAGVAGDYMRGVDAKEGLVAIPRLPGIDGQQLNPGLLTSEEIDWVFTASEIVLNGTEIEPAKGDVWRIVRPDGMFAFYDVLPDAEGRCSMRSDHYGILIRVHTKLNRVEMPPL